MKLLLACVLLVVPGAGAAVASPSAESCAAKPRPAAWVFAVENDKFFAGTDRHYTQGLRLTWLYERPAANPVETAARAVLDLAALERAPVEKGMVTYSLGQDMFTPGNTGTAGLVARDRPYAGWLYSTIGYHTIDALARSCWIAEATVGMVGPAALGEPVQNGWHRLLRIAPAQGWAHQLRNEPGLNLAFEHRWRFAGRAARWDVIPRAGVVAGTVNTHASVGAALRLGSELPPDFGHDLIRTGSGYVGSTRSKFSVYAFVGGEARLVARNAFLDGNLWRASHSVRKRPVTADLNLGLSFNWQGFRLLYTQNYRAREFYGQPRRDVFGSIAAAWLL